MSKELEGIAKLQTLKDLTWTLHAAIEGNNRRVVDEKDLRTEAIKEVKWLRTLVTKKGWMKSDPDIPDEPFHMYAEPNECNDPKAIEMYIMWKNNLTEADLK